MAKRRANTIFTLVLLSLMALSLVDFQPSQAQSQGIITINSEGNVTPSTAPIEQKAGIYTLTGDIAGTITVNKSYLTIDGNGHKISSVLINGVSNVTLKNCIVDGSEQIGEVTKGFVAGISLINGSKVVIANNTILGISNFVAAYEYYEIVTGIMVIGGSSNIISTNNLINNFQAMEFKNTSYNLIVGNNITCSSTIQKARGYHDPAGIQFDGSSNNTIYHNSFEIGIGGQAGDINSVNIWDNGYPSGGNYWKDYSAKHTNAKMIDDSGIGNVSYVIDSQNKDNYPLMSPFDYNLYLFRTTKPDIRVLSAENQTYSSSNVAFNYTVDKATSWIGYSLDNKDNVTVTGNFTITNMTNGMHSIAIYANDTFGNMGFQTSNFNVNQINSTANTYSITTQTLVIITIVAVIAVIVSSLLLYRNHQKTAKPS
jgi:hypothetical protein